LKALSDLLGKVIHKWRSASVRLSPFPAPRDKPLPEATKPVSDGPVSPPELVPGNYYSFKFFIEITIGGTTHLGYPKQAIRDMGKTPPVTVWGSQVELAWPNPAIPRVPWIDNGKKDLTGLTSPEDLLGAEGTLGDHTTYRFEKILDVGKNQVVYSLLCDQNRTRIAYGFSRDLFKQEYGTSHPHLIRAPTPISITVANRQFHVLAAGLFLSNTLGESITGTGCPPRCSCPV
jgi:hypothetical protein